MNKPRIRPADERDLDAVSRIYDKIHSEEEAGRLSTGWIRDIYPVRQTAAAACDRGDLFVLENQDQILGSAIINQDQHPSYAQGKWQIKADPGQVMVLHTLAIDPAVTGRGLGREFINFYASHAKNNYCACLRMDTNARNLKARAIYARYGFTEAGVVRIDFNGINGVDLLLLERRV